MMEILQSPEAWIALVSLTVLEIVLGIDNIVFIAILTDRLPEEKRKLAYRLGLGGAMFTRIGLLLAINWVMHLEVELFNILHHAITGRELILLGGGIFLIGKSAHEIYENVEGENMEDLENGRKSATMLSVVGQIMVLDIIFSLDSVVTAVGVAEHIEVMVTAIVLAVLVMLIFAKPVGDFVTNNPSMKLLALAFLLLIGVLLTAEAFEQHVDKGYIYFAMGFALVVELLNMRATKKKAEAKAQREEVKALVED
jgi:predicted tellurium resistance membrane protein TerC